MTFSDCAADVLVIDDDGDVRNGLARALERDGHPVATATDGRQALDYLLAHTPPRLILLGLAMPGMDGWEFLSRRRHHPHLRTVPVVAFSASIERDAAEAGDGDSAAVLFRPFDLGKILDAARRYCPTVAPAA